MSDQKRYIRMPCDGIRIAARGFPDEMVWYPIECVASVTSIEKRDNTHETAFQFERFSCDDIDSLKAEADGCADI